MTRFIPVIARLGKGIRMKSDQTSEQGENASGESLAVKLAAGRAAVNELAKLLNTLDCDSLTAKSYAVLQDWLQQYCDLADVSPFCEIYRAIMRIVKARSLTTSTYLESTDF